MFGRVVFALTLLTALAIGQIASSYPYGASAGPMWSGPSFYDYGWPRTGYYYPGAPYYPGYGPPYYPGYGPPYYPGYGPPYVQWY